MTTKRLDHVYNAVEDGDSGTQGWWEALAGLGTAGCLRGAVLAVLLLNATACGGSRPDERQLEERRADVAEAGRGVMPFDLDATTHVFEKRDAGGLQRVVSPTNDSAQVTLIRSHLREEAERFARGDFSDPASIHGHDMPGLHALSTGYERLSVTYRDVERGAEIGYESADSALVTALHLWFDAQLANHGAHATSH